MRKNKGFSLVELMIVVAIIGILAAIAIPNFVSMQYKAKRAEVPSNVDGIKTAEIAYEAQFDSFVAQVDYPGSPGKTPVAWDPAVATGTSKIGWEPDGSVRGSYSVALAADDTSITVTGYCDVDGDGDTATYTATHFTSNTFGVGTNAQLAPMDNSVY